MNILISYKHYPVAMGKWFHWALQDLGYKVFSVGMYSGENIPWEGNHKYPEYAFAPDKQIPDGDFSLDAVLKDIEFKPDLIVQASDNSFLFGKAPCRNIVIGTDPHVIDYKPFLADADEYYSMQHLYKENGKWLPYAYYPPIHKYNNSEKVYDVVFSGLQYEHRLKVLNECKAKGVSVYIGLGDIYEEYVKIYNKGLIAFNYSSRNDLPARFWEGLAMKRCVITNKVPDLEQFDCKDGEHYVGFSSHEEAVEKILYYSKHVEEAQKIADNGYRWVQPHTYNKRCEIFL